MQRNHPAIIFATRSGGTTIDQDRYGGNPFATALIRLATASDRILLHEFPRQLRALTAQASQRHQVPEWSTWPEQRSWSFSPGSRQERRCALVLIVSNYTGAGLAPLAGAAHDETRISAMLDSIGFSVVQGVAPTRGGILQALAHFGRVTRKYDAAVLYSTGHGVELDGVVYLLPADFPFEDGYSRRQLQARAVSVNRLATACRASDLNLVFFAGCRTLVSKNER